MNERYTSAAWGGVGKTCLFSCLGALRTSTLCLEIEKKNGTNYKTSSCIKCFTVFKALSHGFNEIKKETPGK